MRIAFLFVFFAAVATFSNTTSATDYSIQELGLKVKLVNYNYKYHPKEIYNIAVEVLEVSDGSLVNAKTRLENKQNSDLYKLDVLSIRVGDILIFDRFIEADIISTNSLSAYGRSNETILSGDYYFPYGIRFGKGSASANGIVKVASVPEILSIVLKDAPAEFSFRVARPFQEEPRAVHYSVQIEVRELGQLEATGKFARILPILPANRGQNEGLREAQPSLCQTPFVPPSNSLGE